jgi:cardiolipin synthase
MSDANSQQVEPANPDRTFFGLNVRPGPDDDGWHTPEPTTLPDGTKLYLLKDGEALRAAFDAIERARFRIGIEVYIMRFDATGRAFADLLSTKAREGVEVYAIVDSFGSSHPKRAMFKQMKSAGVHLAEFHQIRPWECRYSWRPFQRDHRKLLVIDDHVGGLGGLNIGDEYAGQWIDERAKVSWLMRDNAVGVIGPSAAALREVFARTWRYTQRGGPIRRALSVHNLRLARELRGPRLGRSRSEDPFITPRPAHPPAEVTGPFALLASVPTLVSPLRPMLYGLIHNAKQSIRMVMAYFAPDDVLVGELCEAARRGVKVQLIFGGMSDWNFMIVAARSFYQRLLAAGVEVFERQGAVLHAKTMTVDGRFSMIGSTNLDYRSIEFNLEVSAVIDSIEFTATVERLIDHDILYSHRFELSHWRNRPTRDRVVQWCVSRMRYVL